MNGRYNGYGTFKDVEREKFFKGEMNGKTADGQFCSKLAVTQGHFEKGKLEGESRVLFKNGDEFRGLFKQGSPSGYGEYMFQNGAEILG